MYNVARLDAFVSFRHKSSTSVDVSSRLVSQRLVIPRKTNTDDHRFLNSTENDTTAVNDLHIVCQHNMTCVMCAYMHVFLISLPLPQTYSIIDKSIRNNTLNAD